MPQMNAPYPPIEEVIHGVTVKDPYRWLEDRSLPETEEWLQDQKRRCDEYFAACPDLERIRERVSEYLDVEVMDQPARIGEKLFFRRRAKGQEQGCIYVRENGVDRLLVDPSPEGIFISVGIHRISRDGRLLAYERKEGGEDTKSIHIIDVETGQRFSAHLERGFARGFVFTPDHCGFYYCHETPDGTGDHEIRLRRFDESVEDQVVFRAARSRGSRLVLTADDVNIGAISIRDGKTEPIVDFHLATVSNPIAWRHLVSNRSLPFSPLLRMGRVFAVDRERLVELNRDGSESCTILWPSEGSLRDLIIGDDAYALFYEGSNFVLRRWTLNGVQLTDISLPVHGTIRLSRNIGDGGSLFFTAESFTEPPTLYESLPHTQVASRVHKQSVKFDREPPRIEQRSVLMSDGTCVPVTLAYLTKNIEGAVTIMTGYGGFGVPSTPQFSVLVSIMLASGATFVVTHIRGGGEFGKEWAEAARRGSKRRGIEDFIAIAEWLCDEAITIPDKLGIFGGSNGGLLVGAAITLRPDLFRVALCLNPLLDMVRYELFNDAKKWRLEYGAVDERDDFLALYSYSPYHHVEEGVDYPATLIVSGDRDTRCDPVHARKMTAFLQNRDAQRKPILLEYSELRGHSAGLSLSTRINALALRIAFLHKELCLAMPYGDSK